MNETTKSEVQNIKGAGAKYRICWKKNRQKRYDAEIRVTVLGHIQRGGPHTLRQSIGDTIWSSAIELAMEDRWGELVVGMR